MELDEIREWIRIQLAQPSIRAARLWMFDLWRYREDYEKIFSFIEELKGE